MAANVPTSSVVTAELVRMAKRMRFNPISGLTPQTLSQHLDAFATGYLSSFALDQQAIKKRDDVICVALPKREKAVSRLGYAVHLIDGLDQSDAKLKARAEQHQVALKYFFDHITVTSALEKNEKGGMRLLVRQMMEAVGFRYAVHEIVWQPVTVEGKPQLTATFTYVPLQFFENTTGQLRFLKGYFGGSEGEPMEPDAWLVTVGEGIMEPLAVAWMFKQLSLKDWVAFNELLGTPIRIGTTSAAKDTPAWEALTEALDAIGQDFAAVVSEGSKIDFVDGSKGGVAGTFQPLVERMDRAIATICRGADLSTMSAGAGQGQGASLQGGETDLLQEDDAELMTETLLHVSRIVIRELFGPDETPLARVCITLPVKKDAAQTRANIETAVKHGLAVGQQFARDELGIPAPAEGEDVLATPAPSGPFAAALANAAETGQVEAYHRTSLRDIQKAKATAFAGLVTRFEAALALPEPAAQDAALRALQADFPAIARLGLVTEAEVAAWVKSIGTRLVAGAVQAAQAQKTSPSNEP
jgi:phage gp29-like protein